MPGEEGVEAEAGAPAAEAGEEGEEAAPADEEAPAEGGDEG